MCTVGFILLKDDRIVLLYHTFPGKRSCGLPQNLAISANDKVVLLVWIFLENSAWHFIQSVFFQKIWMTGQTWFSWKDEKRSHAQDVQGKGSLLLGVFSFTLSYEASLIIACCVVFIHTLHLFSAMHFLDCHDMSGKQDKLTLLHSKCPKLHWGLTILSAVRINNICMS